MSMLSIVMPTYNEKENILVMLPMVEEFMKEKRIDGEIIIVDDTSPDGTAQAAREMNKKYGNIRVIVKEKKEGIGAALRVGYDSAKGNYILSSDSDMSFKISDMARLLDTLESGFDMVVGSRHVREGSYEKPNMKVVVKGAVSFFGNRAVRALTGIRIHDFSANFRIMRKKTWESIKTTENTNSILLEMIMKAHYGGFKVTEIPVVFTDRLHGESKLNLAREAPKFFAKLIMFTFKFRVLRQLD